jgi:cytochrome c553
MQRFFILLAAAAGLLSAGCSNLDRSRDLADPRVSGKTLAQQVCSACHGIDGNSTSPMFPRLAGQQHDYLVSQLKNFRSVQRSDPAGSEFMLGLSRHLTDKQIDELADYFSSQKVVPTTAVASPNLVAEGKSIFENGVAAQNVIACKACHGEQAQGIGAFPRLANQHADYIIKQLEVFQLNRGRPGTPMEFIAHPLTGSNKKAVAAFLQDFPG